MSIELQIVIACLGSFAVFVLLTQIGMRLLHRYDDPDHLHSWRPQYGDKFGTGRREQVMGYRCRCGRWKRAA